MISVVGEDCSDLLALRKLWAPEHDEGYEHRFRAWWASEHARRRALVAYRGGEPVGMANGQIFHRMPTPGRPNARWMYVANVFVAEGHRRKGIARALLRELIDFAKAEGMVRMVLAPSEMSVPLYESLGFRSANDLMRLDL